MSSEALFGPQAVPDAKPSTLHRGAWIAYLGLGLVAAALYALYPNADHRWLFPLFGAAGSFAVVARIVIHRPTKPVRWIEVGFGIALLAAGDLTYSILEQAASSPRTRSERHDIAPLAVLLPDQ
jgi:hypothetical protein